MALQKLAQVNPCICAANAEAYQGPATFGGRRWDFWSCNGGWGSLFSRFSVINITKLHRYWVSGVCLYVEALECRLEERRAGWKRSLIRHYHFLVTLCNADIKICKWELDSNLLKAYILSAYAEYNLTLTSSFIFSPSPNEFHNELFLVNIIFCVCTCRIYHADCLQLSFRKSYKFTMRYMLDFIVRIVMNKFVLLCTIFGPAFDPFL